MTADLRAAIEAALPDLTKDQADAATALLDALAPPMEEPAWPGAPVIAQCYGGRRRLHVRRNEGPPFGWECSSCVSTEWRELVNPRPLTPAEYAEYGIPEPCTHTTDEDTTQRAGDAR